LFALVLILYVDYFSSHLNECIYLISKPNLLAAFSRQER